MDRQDGKTHTITFVLCSGACLIGEDSSEGVRGRDTVSVMVLQAEEEGGRRKVVSGRDRDKTGKTVVPYSPHLQCQ